MPIYRIETNKGTFEIEANREPTAAEIEAHVSSQGSAQQPAAPQRPRGMLETMMAPPVMDVTGSRGRNIEETLQNAVRGVPAVGRAVTSMGIRGAPPAIGQALGAPLGPGGVVAGGAAGGLIGEGLGQVYDGRFSPGALAGATVANAVPGAPLANAGVRGVLREAIKQGAGNLAGAAAESAIDRGALPTFAQSALAVGGAIGGTGIARGLDSGITAETIAAATRRNAPKKELLTAANAAGFVFSPSEVEKLSPGIVAGSLESIGGKASVAQRAVHINQEATDNLVRKAFGLPPGTPLQRSIPGMKVKGTAEQVIEQNLTPYREIQAIADRAKADLETLNTKTRLTAQNEHELQILASDPKVVKERAELLIKAGADVSEANTLRRKAKEKFDAADSAPHGNSDLRKEGRELWAQAEAIEDNIEKTAQLVGKPDLLANLKQARKRIAQAHVLDYALGHDGSVSAPELGKLLDKNIPLTDELLLIAKIEQNFGRNMRESMKTPSGETNQARAIMGATLGGAAYATGNPMAAPLAAMAPFIVPPMASRAALSSPMQAWIRPRNGYPTADLLAQFLRMTSEDASRRPNSFLSFLEQEFPNRQQRPAPYR